MKVSLCLIVKNEAQHLKDCLSAFTDFFDELIVVDTGSSDETKAIAEEFSARLYDFEWIDDFSAARNFALGKATSDWVMMVDADDRVTPETAKSLKRFIEEEVTEYSVISLPYVYHQTGNNHGNTATLPKVWRRSLGLKYVYPIHEYLDISEVPSDQIKRLDFPILHHKSADDFAAGFARNIKILETYIAEHPEDLRVLYYLVHDYKWLGNHAEAIKWAERYIQANPIDKNKLSKILVHKGLCHLKTGQTMEAAKSFAESIQAAPHLIDAYLYLGDLLFREKEIDTAIKLYEKALSCHFPGGSAFHNKAMYDYSAPRKLCYVLPLVGRYKEALEYGEKTLNFTPDDQKLIAHIELLKKKL